MKINLLFITFLLLLSQNLGAFTGSEFRSNDRLLEIIRDISIRYNVHFTYDREIVEDVEVAHYTPEAYASVDEALNQVLAGTKLKYVMLEMKYVIIYQDDAEGMKSLEQMVEVLEQLVKQNKEKRFVPPLSLLESSTSFRNIHLQKHRVVLDVSGIVTDQAGEPLIGVNVMVQGTTKGTATDFDGRFTLEDVNEKATLVFSYVGYQTQEVEIKGRRDISIIMVEDSQTLDEVVVVGYGTQKKSNLTGSVSTIDEKFINKRIVSQSSQLLQGAASGITVKQNSGEPGKDQMELTIRGLGTFSGAGTNPLVLIDGIPGSINSINPENIEHISILKDAASASIYGSRAANGVVLVTTKKGKKGETRISYNGYFGRSQPTELPDYVNSWTYAEMLNESRRNAGQNIVYTDDEIDKFKSGEDLDNYPNKKHLEDLFKSGKGIQTRHNISVNGGSEDLQYFISGGLLSQGGNIEKNYFNKYDVQFNLNSSITSKLNLGLNFIGFVSENMGPAGIPTVGAKPNRLRNIVQVASHYNATIPGKRSDGTYGVFSGHPVADAYLDGDSFDETNSYGTMTNILLEWSVSKNLRISNRLGYTISDAKNRLFGAEFYADSENIFGPTSVEVLDSKNSELVNETTLNYSIDFWNYHSFNALGGVSVTSNMTENLGGFRDLIPNTKLIVLNAGSLDNQSNSDNILRYKLASYFSRVNYSYKDRYLLEVNFRADGSSRFVKENRYGFFPSVSAGWIVSKENFFRSDWIEFLKFRGSYGVLGNQLIGTYPYQKVLNLGSLYPIGRAEKIYSGVQLNRLPFEDITWETTKVTNFGVDLMLLNGKINFVADFYRKNTEDILYQLTVSQVLGMSVGEQNAGKVRNSGFEFELTYLNTIRNFDFSIKPNFSLNSNRVVSLAGVDRDISKGLFIGEPLTSIYGFKTDGLFVDESDIENFPKQPYTAKPGFPRFLDINGPNGNVDNQVTNEYDRTIIGTRFPKYSYGLSFLGDYRRIDIMFQLQGLAGFQTMIEGDQLAFANFGNIQQWQVDERWTENNPDRNAKYPRLEAADHGYPWDVNLDYWIRDGSFLRLKTIQLGFEIFDSTASNSRLIDGLRIYLNCDNLLTFDRYYKGWDPEMETSGGQAVSYFPIMKNISIGVNLQF